MICLKVRNKKSMKWVIILIAVAVIGTISVWSVLSRQANENKTYTGARFIRGEAFSFPARWDEGLRYNPPSIRRDENL